MVGWRVALKERIEKEMALFCSTEEKGSIQKQGLYWHLFCFPQKKKKKEGL